MAVGIVALLALGQFISATTTVNDYPFDVFSDGDDVEWMPDDDDIEYLDFPGATSEEAFIGPAWLPVPDGWGQDLVVTEMGSEYLTLTPADSAGSQLRYVWEPNGEIFDVGELCSSTLADFTAEFPEASIGDSLEVFFYETQFEASTCSTTVVENEAATVYRITAFLDPSAWTSMTAISQRHSDEPAGEDFDAWDRFLTCSVGDQLGIWLDDCEY